MQNAAVKQEALEPEDLPVGSASRLAATYLRTMEAGDFAAAREMLGPGFTMTFPGNKQYADFETRGKEARLRYRNVRKVLERFDEADVPEGTAVYSIGMLTGEWSDGSPFSDIRYIDRFVVKENKIVGQWVWNDMSEYKSFL